MKINFYITFLSFFIYILIFNIKLTYANETVKSTVKGIFINFELKKNQDNRKYALQQSYVIGLNRYLSWITLKSESFIKNFIDQVDPSNLVASYSIENEKFSGSKYSALITVNYDYKKVIKLLKEKKIKYFARSGPKILVLPLMSFNNQLVLWDDPNPWFESWVERPIDGNLTDFIIPVGDLEDLITINAFDARNLNFDKIKNIAYKYDVKQVLVAFLKIDTEEGVLKYEFRCFDGLTKLPVDIKIVKESNKKNFNITLFDILNSFTSLYDDYWVTDNIKKIESQILVKTNITYDNFRDWILVKNILGKSNNINSFKILKISTKEALTEFKIINQEKLTTELENNKFSVKKNNEIWYIKKYF